MLEAQDGRCAICGNKPRKRRLDVDHNHKTGKVRGLLCRRCNHKGLGAFHDSYQVVQIAEAYLASTDALFHPPLDILRMVYDRRKEAGLEITDEERED